MIKKYGRFVLIAGLAVAAVLGIFPKLESQVLSIVLVCLGLLGGFMSLSGSGAELMMATLVLILIGQVGFPEFSSFDRVIHQILANASMVAAAAAVVLAVKTVLVTSKK